MKINRLIILTVFSFFLVGSSAVAATKETVKVVKSGKLKKKIIRKKVRLYKVGKKRAEKKTVQKDEKPKEKAPLYKNDKRYIKNVIATVRRDRSVTLDTKNISGTSVNFGGTVVDADGNTYAHKYTKQDLTFAIGYGVMKTDGVFYDLSAVILDDEKEFEGAVGVPLNSLEFELYGRKLMPYLKGMFGISYSALEFDLPDSIFFGTGLGFSEKKTDSYSFELEGFYKTKFFRSVSTSYGREQTKEEQFGIGVGIKYFLDL